MKEKAKQTQVEPTGDVLAAITMAMHEFNGVVHDVERDMILTQTVVDRRFSPWNARMLTMRVLPIINRK